MSIGITAFGAYLPYMRLKRETIGAAWERRGLKGERCVANNDEDAVTMAVAAARTCLPVMEPDSIEALYFASVTAPYAEKSHATLAATACNLSTDVFTADFGSTPRAGTSALKAALDAVSCGMKAALVTAADCPLAFPKSDQEQLFGDAGAAVAVGGENVVAELTAFASVNTEIIDMWRNYGERFVNVGEERFISDKGYKTAMTAACQKVLAKAGLQSSDIAKAVFATPGLKDDKGVAKKLGLTEEQAADNYMLEIGNCYSAQPLLLLCGALETAKPGDRLLVAGYGNGADAFIFTVTDAIAGYPRGRFAAQLRNKKYIGSYIRYLSFRGLTETKPGEPFRTFPSNSATWRDQKSILRGVGHKCKACGVTTFPGHRICPGCMAKDQNEQVHMTDRKTSIFTYSIDNLAGRGDDPVVVQTVAEDAEGTRFYMLMTDFEESEIKVGLELEFTFRMVYEGGNFRNYYWKCRPAREGGNE